MTTSSYFIDDAPLQILLFDDQLENGRSFFERGLGDTWFDYDLHVIDQAEKALPFMDRDNRNDRLPDLLLLSSQVWSTGGEQLVTQIRAHKSLSGLPVYSLLSCTKKIASARPECWDTAWRLSTGCDEDALLAKRPFEPFQAERHPARIDGIICANNINTEIPRIINDMASHWFRSSDQKTGLI